MGPKPYLVVVGCALFVGAAPSVASAALAKAAQGGTAPVASYSGTLSSNAAVRQQQLICDPPEPTSGSTSVLYNASLVSLTGFSYHEAYGPLLVGEFDVLRGFVEVRDDSNDLVLQDILSFLDAPRGQETGYVQIFYRLIGEAGQIDPTWTVVDEDPGLGEPGEGVDTHQLLFTGTDKLTTQSVSYTIYADNGDRGIASDFLEGLDDQGNRFRVEYADIHGVTVTGALGPVVPLPGAVWGGMALLGGLGAAKRIRGRRDGDALELA